MIDRQTDEQTNTRPLPSALDEVSIANKYADEYKKLSYRRRTAQCVVSVEILPTATQQCRNYLYDKS